VLNGAGRISGRAQAAVRTLSPSDFNRIVEAGLADENPLLPRTDFIAVGQVHEEPVPFVFDEARERNFRRLLAWLVLLCAQILAALFERDQTKTQLRSA